MCSIMMIFLWLAIYNSTLFFPGKQTHSPVTEFFTGVGLIGLLTVCVTPGFLITLDGELGVVPTFAVHVTGLQWRYLGKNKK